MRTAPRTPARHVNRSAAPAALALGILGVLAGAPAAGASPGTSPGAGSATGTWFDGMTPGVCFELAFTAQGQADFSVPATILDCATPHSNEISGRVSLGDTTELPPDVDAQATAACDAATTAFLGRPAAETSLQGAAIWPDASDWSKGVRDAVCIVVGQGLLGTAAGGDLRLPGGQLAAWWQQEGPARLWIIDTGTAQPVRAVTSETLQAVLGPAAWTPDGTGLSAEVALSDEDHDQVLAAADGSGEQPLVTGPGRQVGAAISPDGTRLAYASNEGRSDYDILVRDLAGGEAVAITDALGRDATPRWSPDGERILFRHVTDGRSEIWLMNADGTDARRLVDVGANAYDPRWMPDGSAILFTTDAAGSMDIWTAAADGTGARRLTDHPGAEEYPTPSPDGAFIAFQSDRHGTPTVWLMRADGSDASLIAGIGPIGYPSFGPAVTGG